MPSGAKKRKAAKKKLQKQPHHFTSINNNASHSQGSDDPKCHDDERDTVGGFEAENVAEEMKQEEREFQNFTDKTSGSSSSSGSTSSGSSSSLDDVEVVLDKETPALPESGDLEPQEEIFATPCANVDIPPEFVEDSFENPLEESVEESIPTQELVKQVVSLPEESYIVSDSVPLGDSSTGSGMKQNVDQVLRPLDEKTEAASEVVHVLHAETEENVIPVVDGGSDHLSEPVGVTEGEDEVLLPQSSSGLKAAEGCCVGDNGDVPETHKYAEEQPLLSSAPMPVRRTSLMNCCGLFEVFSGGSSR